tara:strand:- start:6348 stop:6599 length:252 start_codon:yes stop_codon:yes gene_type:complete
MSFTAIVAGVFAVSKAIPAIRDMVVILNAQILKWELSKITNQYSERNKMVDALTSSISKATTKEERRALSKIMARYTSGNYFD